MPLTTHERVLHLLRLEPAQTSEELRRRLRNPHGAVARYRPDALLAELCNQGLIVGNGDCPQRHFPVAVVQGDDGTTKERIAIWKWPKAHQRRVKHDVP